MKSFNSINVIPFIDILLVLLAMVLTTATFVTRQQLDIDLPTASAISTETEPLVVEIGISRTNQIQLDGIDYTMVALNNALSLLSTDTSIRLNVDSAVEFQQFVDVIDMLKKLSLNRISIATRSFE